MSGGLQEILSREIELCVKYDSATYKARHLSFQTPQESNVSYLSTGGSRHFLVASYMYHFILQGV